MDILRRYEEQLETTIETMRRRCIAIYDGTIRLGKRLSRLCENLREITEPVAYDVKEAVAMAVQDMSPLEPNEMDIRNSILELYLGCSVLSIGLSAGELSGAFVLGALYDHIFDWWWELALVLMLPYYIYLTFRKNAALDEMERRVNLFWLAMCIGSFMGHLLGNRLVSTMPAVAFIQPLIVGLAVDNELSPPSIYSDRIRLMAIASSAGVMMSALLLLICGLSFCSIVTLFLHAAVLFVHFQVVYYCIKNKTYGAGEAQLCYIIATLALHVITGGMLGQSAAVNQGESN